MASKIFVFTVVMAIKTNILAVVMASHVFVLTVVLAIKTYVKAVLAFEIYMFTFVLASIVRNLYLQLYCLYIYVLLANLTVNINVLIYVYS